MTTPVIEAIDNVNQTSLETVFAAVAADPTARDNLSQSDRNIDKVSTNVPLIEELNASEEAIRKMLCRREGFDPANFADLDAVAADQGLMQAIASRQESSKILARSQKASAAAAASQTAMQELSSSQTAMQELVATQTAMTEIDQVDFAVRAIMCATTSQDPTSFANVDAIAQDATAMSEIATNATTMAALAVSQTAMAAIDQVDFAVRAIMCGTTPLDPTSFADADAISQDATAMSAIVGNETTMATLSASQTALQELANSQTAVDEILSATDSILQNTLTSSNVAGPVFDSSSLKESASANWGDARFGADSDATPNNRVIITSDNTGGNGGTNAGFSGVGDVTDSNRVFIGTMNVGRGNASNSANLTVEYIE
jgi:hypothetical protein